MASTFKVKTGPSILALDEVVIGSQLLIAVYLEEELTAGVFTPMSLTGKTLLCQVKLTPRTEVSPDLTFTCVARALEPGWIDLSLTGTQTGTLSERTYEASLKIYPTDTPSAGDTAFVITMPMKYRATR